MLLAQNLDQIQLQGLGTHNTIPKTPGAVITLILPYVFYGAAIALLIYLVLAGLQMMTSRGDPKGMQMAQAKITTTLIGFVIVVFSFAIVVILGKVFGITSFDNIFGSGGSLGPL